MTGQQLHCLQDGTSLPRASFAAFARGLAKPACKHHPTGGVCQHTWGSDMLMICMLVMHLRIPVPKQEATVHVCKRHQPSIEKYRLLFVFSHSVKEYMV